MRWLEEAAFISASRLRGQHHLTAALDQLDFTSPTRVGDQIYIVAQVTAIFGSSLEVMVSAHGERPEGAAPRGPVADAFFTVVAVDERGQPARVPFRLEPVSDVERRRYEAALQRRRERLEMRRAMEAVAARRPSLDRSEE